VNFSDMHCSPRPAPGERIPVWFTGKFTPRLVRRVVALGDGWMPYTAYGMTLAEKAAAATELRLAFAAAGRDPAELQLADTIFPVEGSITRSLEQVPAIAAAGFNIIRVPLRRFLKSPDDIPAARRSRAASRSGQAR
jgi:alkanesulfonate monooxygenase SsuD/methylene tetrahydromethanopterin reductase-like flavin-dependent oxidoreductase (luciferase family)